MRERLSRLHDALKSPEGKNVITFLAFLVISSVLWFVQALNEDTQADLRCYVRITNVPDSLTRVSPLPEVVNVSVRARGTDLLKYWRSKDPAIDIDFRTYKSGNKIYFGEASFKAFLRNKFGAGSVIQSVTPDSLSVLFTSYPGVKLPVIDAVKVQPAPQHVVAGVRKLRDSVTIYSLDGRVRASHARTQEVTLTGLVKSTTVMVPIAVGKGQRAIPDSVGLEIIIEPLISKSLKVPVTSVNLPDSVKLLPSPSSVEVYYMLPMSLYKNGEMPELRIEADYSRRSKGMIPLRLIGVPKEFTNAFMSTDSVEYLIEHE
ncbi:MAG: hypothetical protein NC102_04850 [Clostridium sp.]|nr:hypothetical protein [Clostridium sp.]